ncbi:NUDIX hydrolase [Lentilactobacillus hilgardii]|uniref:hypothetical protein n=1 Tax=Lentilactobacillus hilgardii TaxID=1588 RepID=UPI001CC215C3|nr:hypothetical protein [Lentilactobacillus hilgardii]MBZ2199823.1 hypothetical protein [Lentilactobacillus hilgardii]
MTQFISQDSLGVLEISLAELNINNASPLVWKKANEKNQGDLMCQSKLKMNKQVLPYLISRTASFEKQNNQCKKQ